MKSKSSSSEAKQRIIDELYKPARKKFPRRKTVIKGLDDLWQADLIDISNFHKVNKSNKFILIIIDCFSKYLFVRPLKTKSAEEVTKAMSSIFEQTKRVPRNLQTDEGKEFFNNSFKKLMNQHNINHYHTFSPIKAAIVERVIRTIKEKLYKFFNLQGTYNWINHIDDIVQEYNSTIHSTTGHKPINVTKQKESILLKSVFNQPKIAGLNKFKIGDVVRISKYKHIFEKGYTPKWTTELFKVKKIKVTNPVTYLLEDMRGQPIMGGFYEKELQLTRAKDIYLIEKVVRKRGNKLFVKWLGFDNKFNSWINKSDVQ